LRLLDAVVNERRVVGVFDEAMATKVLALSVIPDGFGEGFADDVAEADGFGLAVGDGVALGLGVGDALPVGDGLGEGVGVALAVGDGLGDGVGVGEGIITAAGKLPPPPTKPPPPDEEETGAAAIVKVLVAAVAARNFVVADALAVMVHEPTAVSVTVEPETVQLPLAENVTGVPEEEVAEIVTGPGIVWGEIVGKLIDCETFTTLKFLDDAPAS
jgi:hypothetical protein